MELFMDIKEVLYDKADKQGQTTIITKASDEFIDKYGEEATPVDFIRHFDKKYDAKTTFKLVCLVRSVYTAIGQENWRGSFDVLDILNLVNVEAEIERILTREEFDNYVLELTEDKTEAKVSAGARALLIWNDMKLSDLKKLTKENIKCMNGFLAVSYKDTHFTINIAEYPFLEVFCEMLREFEDGEIIFDNANNRIRFHKYGKDFIFNAIHVRESGIVYRYTQGEHYDYLDKKGRVIKYNLYMHKHYGRMAEILYK